MEPGGQILSAKWRLLRGYRVRAGADGLSEGFGATISNVADTFFFFFSSRRRHTRSLCDWSSDVCSSDLPLRSANSFATCGWLEKGDVFNTRTQAQVAKEFEERKG